jgi:hypothetical protein
MSKMFYVYALKEMPIGKVFYIGKSTGVPVNGGMDSRRFRDHCHHAKHDAKLPVHCKMRSIWSQGGYVASEVLFQSDNEGLVLNEEMRQIALFGRDNLMNLTDGGEAPNGLRYTAEQRAKLSEKRTGHRHSPETIEKLKQAAARRVITPEWKENMRLAGLRVWAAKSPEQRRQSQETKAKIGAKAKERFSHMTEEQRAQHLAIASKGGKAFWNSLSPEQRVATMEQVRAGVN